MSIADLVQDRRNDFKVLMQKKVELEFILEHGYYDDHECKEQLISDYKRVISTLEDLL